MGRKQHYNNHRYYNPIYYYLLIPAGAGFFILSVAFFITRGFMQEQWVEAMYHLLAGIILVSGIILIQKSVITHQKRIILQEMRLRYFVLTGNPFNSVERKLSTSQILALRFASDSELVSLIEITLEEELTPSQIKKKIKHWKGDYLQV